jgi:catechol 2,3-dioxygenase-like lactoylglutathione lyase family enzyme
MPRGLDHIVHAVRDLDAAAALYKSLGFRVGARNVHAREWGTHNRLIQTPDTFIELLAVADESEIAAHGPHRFSFGAFNRDFLKAGEGLSMLVLKGRGVADQQEFREKSIGDFDTYEFEREGRCADGTVLTFSFALAFASDPGAPDIGFFSCQHRHPPGNFWNPELQTHANGVTGIAGIVAVAAKPERHRAFLQTFTGAETKSANGGFAIATPRGTIEMTTPEAFVARFGVAAPDVGNGARLAAIRFAAADGERLQSLPELAGMAGLYAKNAAVVGADDAMGAVLVFEAG